MLGSVLSGSQYKLSTFPLLPRYLTRAHVARNSVCVTGEIWLNVPSWVGRRVNPPLQRLTSSELYLFLRLLYCNMLCALTSGEFGLEPCVSPHGYIHLACGNQKWAQP